MDENIKIGNVYDYNTDIKNVLTTNHYEGTITILDIYVSMLVSPQTIIKLQNSMRKETIEVNLEQFLYDMKRYKLELRKHE